MRIGIIGSRNFINKEVVLEELEKRIVPSFDDVLLVSNGKGSDPFVNEFAKDNHISVVVFRPYNFVDRKAPHRPDYFYFCNKQIIDNSDEVIVFYDGKEKCAYSAYEYAKNNPKVQRVTLLQLDGSIEEGISGTLQGQEVRDH